MSCVLRDTFQVGTPEGVDELTERYNGDEEQCVQLQTKLNMPIFCLQ